MAIQQERPSASFPHYNGVWLARLAKLSPATIGKHRGARCHTAISSKYKHPNECLQATSLPYVGFCGSMPCSRGFDGTSKDKHRPFPILWTEMVLQGLVVAFRETKYLPDQIYAQCTRKSQSSVAHSSALLELWQNYKHEVQKDTKTFFALPILSAYRTKPVSYAILPFY